ncbi:MAG TPA: Gfo/Idh/MocA family oxidoreductase [Chthonomonadaceae bacterium]|nr:Gfo/Idh/MocA family oxidoreductase [Chthonomonadaceae bacterium]
MGKIGIGVLGGGGDAGEGHIRGYQEDPRAEVIAIWDVDEEKGRTRAQQLGVPVFCRTLEELLAREDIQAVSICTPDHLHGEHAHAALRAGKHVLCEKPMCTTRKDAARLVQDVRETRRTFLGGHVYHFRPDYQAMVAAYRAGEIGEAWLAEGDYISNLHYLYGPNGRTPWRSDPAAPQDILLGGGCHPLGLMRWALGSEVKQVFAYANHKAEPLMPIADCYVMTLTFENGTLGKIIAACGNRGYAPIGGHLVLYGTQGTLWGGRLYRHDEAAHATVVARDFKAEFKDHRPRVHDTHQVHHWAEQAEHFLDCIEGKAEPMTTVLDGARVVAALAAGVESARTGRPVDVDNTF